MNRRDRRRAASYAQRIQRIAMACYEHRRPPEGSTPAEIRRHVEETAELLKKHGRISARDLAAMKAWHRRSDEMEANERKPPPFTLGRIKP